jgi:hypothetical protein
MSVRRGSEVPACPRAGGSSIGVYRGLREDDVSASSVGLVLGNAHLVSA